MYKTGGWGDQAKAYYKKRLESGYYKERDRKRYAKQKALGIKPKYAYESHGTSLGYKGEELGLKVLANSKRIHRPSDLEWHGKRVEVKTAIKQHGNFIQWTTKELMKSSSYRWKFLLKRQRGKVDLFLLICENADKEVEHILLIPDKDLKINNLSISEGSIYKKYSKYRLSLL